MIEILDLVKAVVSKLMEFNVKVYSEDIDENFERPCFFIHNEENSSDNLVETEKSSDIFALHYFPSSEKNSAWEIYDVKQRIKKELIENSILNLVNKKTGENKGNVEIEVLSIKTIDRVVVVRITLDVLQKYDKDQGDLIEDIELDYNWVNINNKDEEEIGGWD